MNWLDTFCFLSVARTQSFSLTAQELMISQQAVSHHINKLEEEIGYPLFLRNYHSSVLTKAGEIFLDYLNQKEALEDKLTQTLLRSEQKRLLRIGWCQWIGCPPWFKAAIQQFRKTHPDITVLTYDLNAQEQIDALEKGSIDILLTSRYTHRHLPMVWNAVPVAELPVYLIGGAHLPYDAGLLSYYPHIAAYAGEPDTAAVRARVIRELAQMNIAPKHIEVVSGMGSACLNALMKGGITMGTLITPMMSASNYRVIPMDRTVTAVICRPFQSSGPLAQQFEQFLLEEQEAAL